MDPVSYFLWRDTFSTVLAAYQAIGLYAEKISTLSCLGWPHGHRTDGLRPHAVENFLVRQQLLSEHEVAVAVAAWALFGQHFAR